MISRDTGIFAIGEWQHKVKWLIDSQQTLHYLPLDAEKNPEYSWINFNSEDRQFYLGPFQDSIQKVVVEPGTKVIGSGDCMFWGLTNCKEFDLKNLDTSDMTSAQFFFGKCESVKNLDLSSLNLDKVSNMSYFVSNCPNIESVDFGNNTLKSAENMAAIMYNNPKLKDVKWNNLDVQNLKGFNCAFKNDESLDTISLKGINFQDIKKADDLFTGCKNLKYVEVDGVDLANDVISEINSKWQEQQKLSPSQPLERNVWKPKPKWDKDLRQKADEREPSR